MKSFIYRGIRYISVPIYYDSSKVYRSNVCLRYCEVSDLSLSDACKNSHKSRMCYTYKNKGKAYSKVIRRLTLYISRYVSRNERKRYASS